MNLKRYVFVGCVVIGISGCSIVEKSTMEAKSEREACQRNYDDISELIGGKSGNPVVIQDPKGLSQGQLKEGAYQVAAGNNNRSYQLACKEKQDDIQVKYSLQKNSGFSAPYYFKFVDAKAHWGELSEGTQPSASTTRSLSDEPPQLTMLIDKLVLQWLSPERTVSDENVAVTIHQAVHRSFSEITYTIANTSREYISIKGISITSGNFNIDFMYPQPQTLPPQRELKNLKLKSPNRLPEIPIDIHSLDELDQSYRVSVSVIYEVNGKARTLFEEFSAPLRELVDFK